MNVKCENCGAGFSFPEKHLKKTGTKVRCSRCKHVFRVFPKPATKPPEAPGATKTTPAPPPQTAHRPRDSKRNEGTDQSPLYKIVEDNNCPLYNLADEFELSDKVLLLPPGKPACLVLVRDVIEYSDTHQQPPAAGEVETFNCSGCTGIISLEVKRERKFLSAPNTKEQEAYIGVVANLLQDFAIFKSVEEHNVNEFISHLRLDTYVVGETILKKGEPGRNLYIVVSGKVEVVGDDDMSIALIDKGEVFGEMSLLSGNPVGASIKVREAATVLYISAKDFRKILNKSPSLQMYFTRLLARRMGEINMARSEEFSSGMTGKLSEMPPSELFQTFNMNQKTGVLSLQLTDETAALTFREGGLIRVQYNDMEGVEAFYELLKLKKGRFKFTPGLKPEDMETPELGDFMHLLMEGLRRIDEADRSFLRTIMPTITYDDRSNRP
jgi:predicted Zn finger-like uncharacterized protein